MERVILNLLIEPTNNLYRDLIDYATVDCNALPMLGPLVESKSLEQQEGGDEER